jgi:hypothetical protein
MRDVDEVAEQLSDVEENDSDVAKPLSTVAETPIEMKSGVGLEALPSFDIENAATENETTAESTDVEMTGAENQQVTEEGGISSNSPQTAAHIDQAMSSATLAPLPSTPIRLPLTSAQLPAAPAQVTQASAHVATIPAPAMAPPPPPPKTPPPVSSVGRNEAGMLNWQSETPADRSSDYNDHVTYSMGTAATSHGYGLSRFSSFGSTSTNLTSPDYDDPFFTSFGKSSYKPPQTRPLDDPLEKLKAITMGISATPIRFGPQMTQSLASRGRVEVAFTTDQNRQLVRYYEMYCEDRLKTPHVGSVNNEGIFLRIARTTIKQVKGEGKRWPQSEKATASQLEKLVRGQDFKEHPFGTVRSYGPDPSMSPGRRQPSHRPTLGMGIWQPPVRTGPTPAHSRETSFTTKDMSLALLSSTGSSMQLDAPITRLTRNLMPYGVPNISVNGAPATHNSLPSASGNGIARLGSPFSFNTGPSSNNHSASVSHTHGSQTVPARGDGPFLGSPIKFEPNSSKRRANDDLQDVMGRNLPTRPPILGHDIFAAPSPEVVNPTRRVRQRGVSITDPTIFGGPLPSTPSNTIPSSALPLRAAPQPVAKQWSSGRFVLQNLTQAENAFFRESPEERQVREMSQSIRQGMRQSGAYTLPKRNVALAPPPKWVQPVASATLPGRLAAPQNGESAGFEQQGVIEM